VDVSVRTIDGLLPSVAGAVNLRVVEISHDMRSS
jgi:hypothetical protein